MKNLFILIWVFLVHLTGLYLFVRGFLLNRLSLAEINISAETLSPTHKRAVFLIIDSLRFDFISPHPPDPPSPYHHHVLQLPYQLTAARPHHSLIFHSFADPPTTTLQRIKGLTTGSLPTFIDMGSNFGGSSIDEDSIIKQLRLAGKKIGFMGDDTWMTVFPDSFEPNMTFPYDSFNVEDLHTVDEGVIRHLFPLLEEETKSWDFLIGHCLGVDHVGHRVGPDHPTMKAKLDQMDEFLARVVEVLDEDTLLVVLGDHGMDRKGDHGGDGDLETSPGLWIYSKGARFSDAGALSVPTSLLPSTIFPGASTAFRSVQQIDLVSSLSLLLGLRIPFNNLGVVIPELFNRGNEYAKAIQINAAQVKQYLDAYRSSPAGGELDSVWSDLEIAWGALLDNNANADEKLASTVYFVRLALSACRSLWAQFNVSLMVLGLTTMVVGLLATWALYHRLDDVSHDLNAWVTKLASRNLPFAGMGAVSGLIMSFITSRLSLSVFDCLLFGTSLFSCLHMLNHTRPLLSWKHLNSIPIILILHTLSFASNSFTFWEDHVVSLFLVTSIAPFVLTGFAAPTERLRYRILGFSALFAVCVRLIGLSTVCREEQQPYCHVTFFASSSLPSPPLVVLVLILPTTLAIPSVLNGFLAVSKSNHGVAALILPWILRPVLVLGSGCWVLEWMESSDILGHEWGSLLRSVRTILGWIAVCGISIIGPSLWWMVPSCLRITTEPSGRDEQKKVTVLGFANAYGAPYLIFWSMFFGALWVTTQLTGQVVLALAVIAILSYLEVVDSVRDVKALETAMNSANPSVVLDANAPPFFNVSVSFSEIVPLALLAIHTFHGTGHQSTIPSIQWKSAFLLTSTLKYPISPALVIMNTFGPQFMLGLASVLLALWNVSPVPQQTSVIHVQRNSLRVALGMTMYFGALVFGSAVSAAWLRRHLMVWKVFAPRFMNAAATGLSVDLAMLVAVGAGVERTVVWTTKIFGRGTAKDVVKART